jgi:UDP-N-acetylglucosamine 2-epimerase (non-hydrolysing)
VTERPEASMLGLSRIVGTSRERIVDTATELLSNRAAYLAMSEAESPYGDGRASERIVTSLTRWFRGEHPVLNEYEQFRGAERVEQMAA